MGANGRGLGLTPRVVFLGEKEFEFFQGLLGSGFGVPEEAGSNEIPCHEDEVSCCRRYLLDHVGGIASV